MTKGPGVWCRRSREGVVWPRVCRDCLEALEELFAMQEATCSGWSLQLRGRAVHMEQGLAACDSHIEGRSGGVVTKGPSA